MKKQILSMVLSLGVGGSCLVSQPAHAIVNIATGGVLLIPTLVLVGGTAAMPVGFLLALAASDDGHSGGTPWWAYPFFLSPVVAVGGLIWLDNAQAPSLSYHTLTEDQADLLQLSRADVEKFNDVEALKKLNSFQKTTEALIYQGIKNQSLLSNDDILNLSRTRMKKALAHKEILAGQYRVLQALAYEQAIQMQNELQRNF